eukprot:SM000001S04801  [mRNA]  locus=s1:2309050:2312362:- [translate_table: standard]
MGQSAMPDRGGPPFPEALGAVEEEARVLARLAGLLAAPPPEPGGESCIADALEASSTDHAQQEGIERTLQAKLPPPRRATAAVLWVRAGPAGRAPVAVVLVQPRLGRLRRPRDPHLQPGHGRLPAAFAKDKWGVEKPYFRCILVHEVWIRPYQACFQLGDPIYSANFVRFRLGRQLCGDGKEQPRYQWTAETPTYAMLQEDTLQCFRLPQPMLCLGGVLQVELLGRMQKQASDNLYYICVCHVRVIGRLLHHFRSYLLATDGLVLLYNERVLEPAAMAELRQAARGEGEEEVLEGPLQASWNSNVPAGEVLDHLVALMQDAPREARWLAEHLPETYRNLGLLFGTGNILAVAGEPARGGSSNAEGLHDYEGQDDDNEHDDWERED